MTNIGYTSSGEHGSVRRAAPRRGRGVRGCPLDGWLHYGRPGNMRVRGHAASIVAGAGMDFNQFTYRGLRRDFRAVGFRQVLDRVELGRPAGAKGTAASAFRAIPPLRM